jgi:hypothetical protein
MWANASCMLYKGKLSGKVYIGCTKLPLQERLQNMKTKPVSWLRGHKDLQKLRLTHLCDRRVPEAKALALEAAFTAEQWQGNPGGGPRRALLLGSLAWGPHFPAQVALDEPRGEEPPEGAGRGCGEGGGLAAEEVRLVSPPAGRVLQVRR